MRLKAPFAASRSVVTARNRRLNAVLYARLLGSRRAQGGCHCFEYNKRVPCSVRLALLKFITSKSHRIGDVCETENANACRAGEAVERGRLHFDRENPFATRRFNSVCGLPERRVRCPARADDTIRPNCGKCSRRHPHQVRISFGKLRGRGGSDSLFSHPATHGRSRRNTASTQMGFVCPAEVRLTSNRHPLANNSSAIRTAKDAPTTRPTIPTQCPPSSKGVEFRMIAGPALERLRRAALAQPAHQIAVRIEDTHGRYVYILYSFLPTRFLQQDRRRKDGFRRDMLVVEDGRRDHVGDVPVDPVALLGGGAMLRTLSPLLKASPKPSEHERRFERSTAILAVVTTMVDARDGATTGHELSSSDTRAPKPESAPFASVM